jgi:hypothetical protein
VSAWDFKSYGSAFGGPVGSIPTHFRQILRIYDLLMARRRKLKPFRATKEVKRRARLLVGSVPPVRREESPKLKPPKHKKRDLHQDSDGQL